MPLEILAEEQDLQLLRVITAATKIKDTDLDGLWLYGAENTGKTNLAYTISKLTKRDFVYFDFSGLDFSQQPDDMNKEDFNLELAKIYKEKIEELFNKLEEQNAPFVLFIHHIDKAASYLNKTTFEIFANKLKRYKQNNNVILIFSSIANPEGLIQHFNYSNLVHYLNIGLPSYGRRLKIIDYCIQKTLYKEILQSKGQAFILVEDAIGKSYKENLAKETQGFSCKDIKTFMDNAAIAIKEGLPYNRPIAVKKNYKRKKNDCCPTFLTIIFDWASEDYDKSKLNVYECYVDNYYMNQKNQVERRKALNNLTKKHNEPKPVVNTDQANNKGKEKAFVDKLKEETLNGVKEVLVEYTKKQAGRGLNEGTDFALNYLKNRYIPKTEDKNINKKN